MNFLELANKRYSVRNYSQAFIPREKITRCIEAARLAPSACNSQPWKFIVVDEPGLKTDVAGAAFGGILDVNHFAFKAPVLILIVSQRQKLLAKIGSIVKRKNFSLMDIGIAAEHFCLQAAEEGLGTCILGWFNEKKIKKILGIPKNIRLELIISAGLSADEKIPCKIRKSPEEIASYNKYL
ncbi:MAG: nitroreductase family protein [Sedimentisphaerales bacterium]|jgi:nitroreductase